MNKVYFSSVQSEKVWVSSDIAYLFAVPKKWWSFKHWALVNSFLKSICGFLVR